MPLPKATIILVAGALLFVLWDQLREQPGPITSDQFSNLAAQPAERSVVLDWAVEQVPRLCKEATGAAADSREFERCMDASEASEPACRRAAADHFPSTVTSEPVFRDLSITMMDCLVRQSRLLGR